MSIVLEFVTLSLCKSFQWTHPTPTLPQEPFLFLYPFHVPCLSTSSEHCMLLIGKEIRMTPGPGSNNSPVRMSSGLTYDRPVQMFLPGLWDGSVHPSRKALLQTSGLASSRKDVISHKVGTPCGLSPPPTPLCWYPTTTTTRQSAPSWPFPHLIDGKEGWRPHTRILAPLQWRWGLRDRASLWLRLTSTSYVAEDDLELEAFRCPPPRCWSFGLSVPHTASSLQAPRLHHGPLTYLQE